MSGAHEHGHDQGDHRHPPQPDADDTLAYPRKLEIAVRELLIEKGVFTADEVRAAVEDMDGRTPERGAKVVARAWVDPEFRKLLLADAGRAVESIGCDWNTPHVKLTVVENTPEVHNVIVCTLCSCYPRALLGLPPSWYKSFAYRSRMVREPRTALKEFGMELPERVVVRVHDSTADLRYMVLPMRPEGTGSMSEAQLAALVTRDCMIGTAVARRPEKSGK
ncbi:MAG: nitrile hydratase subunit alpha [Betaproteobacteria bacterium]|nr:nitrile hydratase subunit alpha [Betaproteobacteria bacterium]